MYVCPRGYCTFYKKPLLLDVCPGREKSNICGMSEEGSGGIFNFVHTRVIDLF